MGVFILSYVDSKSENKEEEEKEKMWTKNGDWGGGPETGDKRVNRIIYIMCMYKIK
jgi:hypothetical protein